MMAADVTIRSLTEADWERYRNLRLKSLRENPIAYGVSEADETSRKNEEWKTFCKEAEIGEKKYFMVAESNDGNLIGMLGAVEIYGALMRHQVEIVQAYVDPLFRRLKVMEKLFLALKEKLQKVEHLEQMIGWVTLHENQVGKTMFEQWGFKLAGKLTKTVKYEGKYYDCCWLEAPLK